MDSLSQELFPKAVHHCCLVIKSGTGSNHNLYSFRPIKFLHPMPKCHGFCHNDNVAVPQEHLIQGHAAILKVTSTEYI